MGAPFDEPKVYATTKVRLVEVFGVDIIGGLGTRAATAVRVELPTAGDRAKLGWTEVANSAITTVAILVRFTQAAISIDQDAPKSASNSCEISWIANCRVTARTPVKLRLLWWISVNILWVPSNNELCLATGNMSYESVTEDQNCIANTWDTL